MRVPRQIGCGSPKQRQVQALFDFEPLALGRRYALTEPLRCRMLNRGFNDAYLSPRQLGAICLSPFPSSRTRRRRRQSRNGVPGAPCSIGGYPAAPIPTGTGVLFLQGEAREGIREVVLFNALDRKQTFGARRAFASHWGRNCQGVRPSARGWVPELPASDTITPPRARNRPSGHRPRS
jgi:hypothetical protein